jgi:hypothetical protein
MVDSENDCKVDVGTEESETEIEPANVAAVATAAAVDDEDETEDDDEVFGDGVNGEEDECSDCQRRLQLAERCSSCAGLKRTANDCDVGV